MPLTTLQLDTMECSAEKCGNTACTGEMAIHSACHPDEPTWSWYQGGVLTVKCAAPGCGKIVCQIAVQSGY